jgi:twitching motility protein PilI
MSAQETPAAFETTLEHVDSMASSEARHGIVFSSALGELRCLLPKGLRAELIHSPNISALPSSKPWLVGIVNVRGELVPVIDLLRWAGLNAAADTVANLTTQILLLGQGESAIAITTLQAPQFVLTTPSNHYAGLEVPKLLPYISAKFIADKAHWIDLDFDAWLTALAER